MHNAETLQTIQQRLDNKEWLTTRDIMKLRELDGPGIDTALPQAWFNECHARTGQYPAGHVVMDFRTSLFGTPTALTLAGQHMIDVMARTT